MLKVIRSSPLSYVSLPLICAMLCVVFAAIAESKSVTPFLRRAAEEVADDEPTAPTATATRTRALSAPTAIELKELPKFVTKKNGFAFIDGYGLTGTTGGRGGPIVVVDNHIDFIKYISLPHPYVILIDGMIDLASCNFDYVVESDKTIMGIGRNSGFKNGGLKISGVKFEPSKRRIQSSRCRDTLNFIDMIRQDGDAERYEEDIKKLPSRATASGNVIIRNLNFENCERDCIGVENFGHHVWIDHNTFSNPGDGAVDIKRGSDLITVSWNQFSDAQKTLILGHNDDNVEQDTGKLRTTYHHNHFQGTDQRNPRVRAAEPVHIYNNYYQNNKDYGIASVNDAGAVVEGNYFEGLLKPYRVVMEAAPIPGRVVARDNYFDSSSVKPPSFLGGSVVEPNTFYDYRMSDALEVPEIVKKYGGAGVIY